MKSASEADLGEYSLGSKIEVAMGGGQFGCCTGRLSIVSSLGRRLAGMIRGGLQGRWWRRA
jgi:hypothetical protein